MAEFEEKTDFEEYEPDLVELDGEQFEIVDALTYENVNYLALVLYDEDADEEDEDEDAETEFIVLQEIEEDGEYFLSTVDDEALSDKIGDMFLARFEELADEFGF
ncbi:MAG: DUF1292 domain-containing protein [Oscillospiraceae bacterium]|nr:DUF1292 domain-containing protein [Oscillospiraceae bacterium]